MVDDDVCIAAAALLHASSGARRPATGRRADGLVRTAGPPGVRLPAVCRGLPALPQASGSCQWCECKPALRLARRPPARRRGRRGGPVLTLLMTLASPQK